MSFFAVLKAENSTALQILDCHLNLWSMEGILGHRLFFFDVGLAVNGCDQQGTSTFELAIPFGTRAGGLSDLGQKLRNEEVLNLIFSGSAKLSASGTQSSIDYGGKQLRLCFVDTGKSQQVTDTPDFSIWNVHLAETVKQGHPAYIRLRFEVDCLGRAWLWKRSAGAKNGALVDIRVGDVRGAPTPNGRLLASRVLNIEKLFVFVIAPFWLKLQTASPILHYIRILEGKVWEPYLGIATRLFGNDKSVIYQWRKENVSADKDAFHAFLYLGRDSPLVTYFAVLRATLLLAGTVAVAAYMINDGTQVAQIAVDHIGKIGVGGFLFLAYTLFKDWSHIRDLRAFFRRRFHRLEYALLRMRATFS